MKRLLDKYASRLVAAGLALPDAPLLAGLDDELEWNRPAPEAGVLSGVLDSIQANSLLCFEPAPIHRAIIGFLASRSSGTITPEDCETRTFLHDLPVVQGFTTRAVSRALSLRKCAVIVDDDTVRVAAHGTVSPEQAFVTASSVCFASFVLFFSDYLRQCRAKFLRHEAGPDAEFQQVFNEVQELLPPPHRTPPRLATGPFTDADAASRAMSAAGRLTVQLGLVDSFFGNVSCRVDDTILISQTGSSLDELEGCIDACPMDGSSCAGLTASSELTAHSRIYETTDAHVILHGHPRFAVILSMLCDEQDCPNRGRCHIRCAKPRTAGGVPIVPGEVGTGPFGLCNTLPAAIAGQRGAIVHGHGLFTTSRTDFDEAFSSLLEIENTCRDEYFRLIDRALADGSTP